MKIRQLTDDDISNFAYELSEYLDNHPLIFKDGEMTDEGYDAFYEFIHRRLSPFSNGYMNHN